MSASTQPQESGKPELTTSQRTLLERAAAAARQVQVQTDTDSADLRRLREIEEEIRTLAKPLAEATEASERITQEDLAVRITVRD